MKGPTPFRDNRKTVKNALLDKLATKWPLTAKQLYREIRPEFGAITYQNVHKVLHQLKAQEIVMEENRKYQLDSNWISNLKEFAEDTSQKYQNKPEISFAQIENNTSKSFEFDSYAEPFYSLLREMETLRKNEKDIAVGHAFHAWLAICISKKEYDQFKKTMPRGKNYLLVRSETVVDYLLGAFWNTMNTKVKYGVPCALNCDLLVIGDNIIQMYFPTKLKKFMDSAFKGKKLNPKIVLSIYAAAFENFGKTRIVITKNAEVANQIREETLTFFKK